MPTHDFDVERNHIFHDTLIWTGRIWDSRICGESYFLRLIDGWNWIQNVNLD